MAKGSNASKSNRSHNYKPYDASNSSLFKRITSRVTEILPGQSWISGWLSNTPQVDVRQDRDDEDDDEEEEGQQPLAKRIRLQTSTNDYIHQNHVKRLSDLQDDSESLSTISRIDYNDGAVAGPSGLHLRRTSSTFVSSTPATTQTSSASIAKVNTVEAGSESSESTSGCSSMVPQIVRTPGSSTGLFPKHTPESNKKLFSPGGGLQRLSTPKDKCSKLNLSTSSSCKPSFDYYVFHNPHRSLNSSRNSQLNDSSPFYKGRTMYGGASGSRETLSESILSPSTRPRIINVKPVARQFPDRDTIGTSALKIFRALEQISSPATEAKKMPLNVSQRKRKAIQPFEELSIPQMPALLRIKRRQLSESIPSSSTNIQETKLEQTKVEAKPTSSVLNSNAKTSSVTTTTAVATPTKPSLPTYWLRSDADEVEQRRTGRFVLFTNQNEQEVVLPNVKLEITSLPKFSLPAFGEAIPVTRISTPTSNLKLSTSAKTTIQPQNSPRLAATQFKFSEPIVESPDGHKLTSIKTLFKFSNPLDAESPKQESVLQNHKKLSNDKAIHLDLGQDSSMPVMKCGSPPKLKKKIHQDIPKIVEVKETSNYEIGDSIMDFFNKNKISVITKDNSLPSVSIKSSSTKSKSLPNDTLKAETKESHQSSEKQSSPDNKWSCKKCLIENNKSDNCIKCGQSRFKDNIVAKTTANDNDEIITTSELIKCKTCSSSCSDSNKCPSCTKEKTEVTTAGTTVTSTSTSSLPPLSALFKKSAGSWECDACLVSNKGDTDVCISCSTPKPGSAPKLGETESAKPTFQFGIPPSVTPSTVGLKFGIEQSNNGDNAKSVNSIFGGFKFGSESTTLPVQDFKFGSLQSTNELDSKKTFSFGVPSETSTKKDEKEQSEIFSFENVPANDRKNETKEDSKPNSSDKNPSKKVSFSQPLVEEKTISSESISNKSFNFTNATDKSEDINKFSFPAKTPLFGNSNNPLSSTTDNSAVSSSLFKFGNSTAVSSTTIPISTSASIVNTSGSLISSTNSPDVSSVRTANSENAKTSSTFSFIANNSISKTPFTSSVSDKKEQQGIFRNFNDKTSQSSGATTLPATNFIFGSSTSDNQYNASKETKKEGLTNSMFGEKSGNESKSLFNIQPQQNEEKPNIFGSDTKPQFFDVPKTNENVDFFGRFSEDWNTKPSFGAETFQLKPAVTSAPPLFGSSALAMSNSTIKKNEPFLFNATPSQSNNAATSNVFKHDVTDNKPSGGFTFTGNAQMQNTSNIFGSNSQQTPNIFSSTLFSTAAQPVSNPTSPAFTFGSQQTQESQGLFTFGGAQQTRPANVGQTFTFGSQNAALQNTPAPPAPVPTFDPNIKPNFNFSGATTPTFSAQSTDVEDTKQERKIKKAIRRTIR